MIPKGPGEFHDMLASARRGAARTRKLKGSEEATVKNCPCANPIEPSRNHSSVPALFLPFP